MNPFGKCIFIVAGLTFSHIAWAGKKSDISVSHFVAANFFEADSLPRSSAPKSTPPKKIKTRFRHYKRGDTLLYCEVLKLTKMNGQEHILAVFASSYIWQRRSKSRIKIMYILQRERDYLSTIFYTKAKRLERKRVDTRISTHMKMLKRAYPFINMWSVMDANAILHY